ncbi:hypothetical protein TYRP_021108 [Tyrophagus putrescentiae]|nr:hypothetical protein TYRP_021108 [Tyrophagus putrescentiae]
MFDFQFIHSLTGVPMEESLVAKHGSELLQIKRCPCLFEKESNWRKIELLSPTLLIVDLSTDKWEEEEEEEGVVKSDDDEVDDDDDDDELEDDPTARPVDGVTVSGGASSSISCRLPPSGTLSIFDSF